MVFSNDEAISRFISWKKLFAGHEWEPMKQEDFKKIVKKMEDLYLELLMLKLDLDLRAQSPRKP